MIRFLVNCCSPQGCYIDAYGPMGTDEIHCSKFSKSDLSFGIRFTDWGRGVQIENTAAGLMAGSLFERENRSRIADISQGQHALAKTLYKLFQEQGDLGLPASFRSEPSFLIDDEGEKTEILNTGIAWSYFRQPHLASTTWAALALRYFNDGDMHNNPYRVGHALRRSTL